MASNYWLSTQLSVAATTLQTRNLHTITTHMSHSEASKELSWEFLASTHKHDRKLLTADEVALIKTYFCVCLHRFTFSVFTSTHAQPHSPSQP